MRASNGDSTHLAHGKKSRTRKYHDLIHLLYFKESFAFSLHMKSCLGHLVASNQVLQADNVIKCIHIDRGHPSYQHQFLKDANSSKNV